MAFTSGYVPMCKCYVLRGPNPSPQKKLRVRHCVYVYVPVTYHAYNIDIIVSWNSCLFVCVGVDLVRQNSITQQILAQYLQKRLNRAGGSVQVGQQQLAQQLAGIDSGNGGGGNAQKYSAENPLTAAVEDDVDVGDAEYYQGQIASAPPPTHTHIHTHTCNLYTSRRRWEGRAGGKVISGDRAGFGSWSVESDRIR